MSTGFYVFIGIIIFVILCFIAVGATLSKFFANMEESRKSIEEKRAASVLAPGVKPCEEMGDWTPVGECGFDGMIEEVQTYKDNTIDGSGCPPSAKSRKVKCCYEKGNWRDSDFCQPDGTKQQKQTVVNCPSSKRTRTVECKYKSPWVKDGECSSDGKQKFKRVVSDESDPTTKVEDCCYTSPWVDVGKCKTGGVQNQKRTVVNCRASTRPTQQVDCCFIGDWEDKGSCSIDGKVEQTREVSGCLEDHVTERTVNCTYTPCTVRLYEGRNQTGDSYALTKSCTNFDDCGVPHDAIMSFKINGSACKVLAYEHPNYEGQELTANMGKLKDGEAKGNVPSPYENTTSSLYIENL
jgi:hypothetical protein